MVKKSKRKDGTVMINRVAIVFLITKKLYTPFVWEQWLKLAKSQGRDVSAYAHISENDKDLDSEATEKTKDWCIANKVTMIPSMKTSWGGIDMCKAIWALFRASFENTNVFHSLLVSQNCVPVIHPERLEEISIDLVDKALIPLRSNRKDMWKEGFLDACKIAGVADPVPSRTFMMMSRKAFILGDTNFTKYADVIKDFYWGGESASGNHGADEVLLATLVPKHLRQTGKVGYTKWDEKANRGILYTKTDTENLPLNVFVGYITARKFDDSISRDELILFLKVTWEQSIKRLRSRKRKRDNGYKVSRRRRSKKAIHRRTDKILKTSQN